jgi:pimeloyl-ACP methyl ester carboxylesterase
MEMVEDQVRLLDHLKIRKAHVVGYSMGAMITAKLMTTHPERLRSATLGGAAGLREGTNTDFFNVLADSLDQGKGVGPLLVALTPAARPKPTEDQIKMINGLLNATNDTKALAAVVRGWKELTIPDQQLRDNRVPVLGLVGAEDPLKQRVDDFKEVLPKMHEVVIKDADHMNAFTKPEFLSALEKFLAPHRAGTKTQKTAAPSSEGK